MYYFDLSFPKKKIKIFKRRNEWMNQNLKVQNKTIKEMIKLSRNSHNSCLYPKIKEINKKYRKELIKAKKSYFDQRVLNSTNVQKTTWKLINSEIGSHNDSGTKNIELREGSKVYSDPLQIGNILNSHFVGDINNCSIAAESNLDNILMPILGNTVLSYPEFHLEPTTEKEINSIINSLKNSYSAGYDEVPIIIIKKAKQHLSKVLSHLINSSFISGTFPAKLKLAKIIPVHKKGDTKDKTNYRPISILPSFSKIFEKVVSNRLLSYLEHYELLDHVQHGFRSGRSVKTAAVSFIDSVIQDIDKGQQVIGVFMDLCNAFGSVILTVLLTILYSLGIRGKAFEWFRSYLIGRRQFVEITYKADRNRIFKVASCILNIILGVPQGSVLGPLLFLCYLKGMPKSLQILEPDSLCLYADDSNLKIAADTEAEIERLSLVELSNIIQFFNSINLKLNIHKTNFISFLTKQNRNIIAPTILVNTQEIEHVTETKFLGLTIDQHLSWDSHVNNVLTRISSGLYALKRMAVLCNRTTLKHIYFAYIHSHISYGICVYGATTQGNLESILKLQKRAIRIIVNVKPDVSVRDYFKELEIMTVFGMYIFDCIWYIKNNPHLITKDEIPHTYNTRKKDQRITTHSLELNKKGLSTVGINSIICFLKKYKKKRVMYVLKRN